ncbi:MAG: S8 family peptidase [Lachnospiraceae bacterium]|nr:S8 family peptidase [Lachnospiraceae bacterium]
MEYVYRLPVPPFLSGEGVRAAILDTGIVNHPDFEHRVLLFKDFVHGKTVMYDDNGHGTHVAGILGGSGRMSRGKCRGIAPKVQIIALKVLDRHGNGSLDQILNALDWLWENFRKYEIRIVNISIGTLPDRETKEGSLMMEKIDRLWDADLCIFAAAGNAGPEKGSITSPGINRKIITVGCCEPFPVIGRGKKIQIRCSGRGPVPESCVMKPEIVAYGKDILSCNYRYMEGQKAYVRKSGTSMAAPMAAGSAALLLEQYPGLSNAQVKLCFHDSCRNLWLPSNQQGWGLIQPDKLLKAGAALEKPAVHR